MITPVFREEYFLDAIIKGTTPPDPVFRVEFFLAKIAGADVVTPTPIFRIEKYLAKIGGEDVEIPDPVFREEYWLAKKCGENVTTPTPVFRLEYFLEEWVNGSAPAYQSVTGKIVSFLTQRIAPLKIEADLSPIQDLHGYDAPWPPGGGKNLLDDSNIELGINSLRYARTEGYGTPFTLKANTTYTISCNSNTIASSVLIHEPFSGANIEVKYNSTFITYTPTEDVQVGFTFYWANGRPSDATHIQVELGQSASAYSPYSNICPISGHTGADVYDNGVNQWDEEIEAGSIYTSNGEDNNSSSALSGTFRSKNYIPVKENTAYYFKPDSSSVSGGVVSRLFFYDKDKGFISSPGGSSSAREFTTPSGACFIRFFVNEAVTSAVGDGSINYPSTDHDYHAFVGTTVSITFGTTVYGGKLTVNEDGSGTVVSDMAYDQMTYAYLSELSSSYIGVGSSGNTLWVRNWNYQTAKAKQPGGIKAFCNAFRISMHDTSVQQTQNRIYFYKDNVTVEWFLSTVQALETDGSGLFIAYELETPVTIQLTASQVNALQGDNTVWVDDSGEIKVTYRSN